MADIIREDEIDRIVNNVLSDYNKGKNIDAFNLFNNPDKTEVREIVGNLFKIVFPGYFRHKTFKIYNPKNSLAVTIEDIFYHLNKQVLLALDFCRLRGVMTEDERKAESYRICLEFFEKIPMIRDYVESDLIAAFDGDPAPSWLIAKRALTYIQVPRSGRISLSTTAQALLSAKLR